MVTVSPPLQSLSAAGDVNGDGYADVMVGRHGLAGYTHVYHGSAAGLTSEPAWIGDRGVVSTAGDVNGDGYAEVLRGRPSQAGQAFLHYGNDGRGLSLGPRQRGVTDARPVAHLGASDSPDSFRLAILGRTPFGRGRVKLEWETKPLGLLLNGHGTKQGVHWHDTGVEGVELSELETGLFDETVYHWRVRLLYDPVTTPFAQASRWLTMPWNGWQEADLRTGDPAAAGRVPDQAEWPGEPLRIDKAQATKISLSWAVSCLATDTDYAIYEGTLGEYDTHESRYCSTGGDTSKTFTPLAADTYYLVVPLNSIREGSYGTDSEGAERPPGEAACLPQEIGTCP
jgi:hypothetical protein